MITAIILILCLFFSLMLLVRGYRYSRVLMIILSFIAGYAYGSSYVPDSIYNTSLGWVLGTVFGAYFALLAYLFYSFGFVVLLAIVGYCLDYYVSNYIDLPWALGIGVMGAILGIIIGLVALFTKKTKPALIVGTSIFGAIFLAVMAASLVGLIIERNFDYSDNTENLTFISFVITLVVLLVVGVMLQRRFERRAFSKKPKDGSRKLKLTVANSALKKLHSYRWIIASIATSLIVMLFIFATMYISKHALGFQIYEPTKIPSGAKIIKRSAESLIPTDASVEKPTYIIAISNDEFGISQQKNVDNHGVPKSDEVDCLYFASGYTCNTYTTNKGTKYAINTRVGASGNIYGLSVRFFRGDTYIWLSVKSEFIPKYSNFDWSEFIDSFAPVDPPSNLKIIRRLPL